MKNHYEIHLTNYEIAGAHYLELPYPSPCQNLHGHSWLISIHIKSDTLAPHGMILDFKHIKDYLKMFDHKTLNQMTVVNFNPTAENLAKHFGEKILDIAAKENCFGIYEVCCEVQESKCNIASWVWERD